MKRVILACLVAVGLFFGATSNAYAYVSRTCTIYLTARLSTTAWQISGSTTRLHMDLNPYSGTGTDYYSRKILLDGYALTDAYGSYQVNDVYRDRSASSSHTVQGWWRGSNGYDYACSVSIPAYPGY